MFFISNKLDICASRQNHCFPSIQYILRIQKPIQKPNIYSDNNWNTLIPYYKFELCDNNSFYLIPILSKQLTLFNNYEFPVLVIL